MYLVARKLGFHRFLKNPEPARQAPEKKPPPPVSSQDIIERRSSSPFLEWSDEDDLGLRNYEQDQKSKPEADSALNLLPQALHGGIASTPDLHEQYQIGHASEDAISGFSSSGYLKPDFDNAQSFPGRRLSETLLLQTKHESEPRARGNPSDDHTGNETLLPDDFFEGDDTRDHTG